MWEPDFTKCQSIPDVYAVLAEALQNKHRFKTSFARNDGSVKNVEMSADYVSSFLRDRLLWLEQGASVAAEPAEMIPSEFITQVNKIIRAATDRGIVPLMGIGIDRHFKYPEGNPRPPKDRKYYSRREYDTLPHFSQCRTPADLVAVLYRYIDTESPLVNDPERPAPKMHSDALQRDYTKAELMKQLETAGNIFVEFNKQCGRLIFKTDDVLAGPIKEVATAHGFREAVVNIVAQQASRGGQPFPVLPSALIRLVAKELGESGSEYKVQLHAPTEGFGHRLPEGHELRDAAAQAQDAQRSVPRPNRFPWRLASGVTALFGAAAVCAGVAGVGYFKTKQDSAAEPTTQASEPPADTGAGSPEDVEDLHRLTDEQQKDLKEVLRVSHTYYVPFVRELMLASTVGVTIDGKISHDPKELVAGLDQATRTLDLFVEEGKVRSYTAQPGREDDIRFGQSAARFVPGKPSTKADDLMALDSINFFGKIWHRVEMAVHEMAHRTAPTNPEAHNNITGDLDRDSAGFGESILEYSDCPYYFSALFGAFDTILAGEVDTAKDSEAQGHWAAPTTEKQQADFGHMLADWYVKNHTVLQPFGIKEAGVEHAIVVSRLVELGNHEAADELALVKKPADSKREGQKKRKLH